ncbi:MAG TPA: terminase large subunit [Solirubrobacteraceae bacterium]|jgi:hypothetical protein|nr:terminase large subunit [Solirubrobacteraceae bacterium]
MNAREVLGLLRLDDGRPWIAAATDWQRADALAVLEGAEPYSFITRSRASSKTTDLSACALSDLLTADDRLRSYWLAADADQGALALDVIGGFVARTPTLADRVEVQSRRVVIPATDCTLDVLPADAPSAWGLNPHRVYVDELANWTDGVAARRLWEAASSAVAKRSDARLCVLTTAGSPDHFAFKVLEHARTSPLWHVSERVGAAPWIDPERLAEQRVRLPTAIYEQLWENLWVAVSGSFLDPSVLAAAFTLPGPRLAPDGHHSFFAGLDLGLVNDATVFAIGHRDGDTIYLDRMETWQGSKSAPVDITGVVEPFIIEQHRRFHFHLKADPWQGMDLVSRLKKRNVKADTYTFSTGSKQKLAQTLLSTVNNGALRLYDAQGLKDELEALRLVQSSSTGGWSFDHTRQGHDDRSTALSLMVVAALEQPSSQGWLDLWTREAEDAGTLPHKVKEEGN